VKRVPIEDSLDLHSFFPRDVPDVVSDYLDAARRRGFREVRLIHGKGRGVRRAEVRKLLAADPRVAEMFDAPPERGGMGATIVILRPED
jgi:DNA-nicking Smr family endonuclease